MRRVASSRGLAARISRGTRLVVETLEHRRLLSGAPAAASPGDSPALNIPVLAANTPASQASGNLSGDGAPLLVRRGLVVEAFEPLSDTDADRGQAFRDALAAALAGDEVLLGACTYDLGGAQHVDIPSGVTVTGAGKTDTRLTSSCPIHIDAADIFTLSDQSTIQDCWLEGSLNNGWYQTIVGMAGLPTRNVTAYLRRVKITGDSDGIYIWTGNQYQYTVQAYDCDINTKYDAVALLGSGSNLQSLQMWNCNLTVAQPSSIPFGVSNCVNVSSGTVQLYNCTLTATGDATSNRTNAIWARTVGLAEARNCTFNVTAPNGPVYDFEIADAGRVLVTGGTGSGPGGAYLSSSGSEIVQPGAPAAIKARRIFYNHSAFDGQDPAANLADAQAIATDKVALLPGAGQATFASVSGYAAGINGVIVDVSGYHGSLTADDFSFRLGNNNMPATWSAAPAPVSITMFGRAGAQLSDRVQIVWADGAIRGQWLEVTLLANLDTGLSLPDVFYFGSAPGDTGAANSNGCAVSSADEISARNDPHGLDNPAAIDNPNDIDRDRFVNSADQVFMRNNFTNLLTVLKWILPAGGGGETAAALQPAAGLVSNAEPSPVDLAMAIAIVSETQDAMPSTWSPDLTLAPEPVTTEQDSGGQPAPPAELEVARPAVDRDRVDRGRQDAEESPTIEAW